MMSEVKDDVTEFDELWDDDAEEGSDTGEEPAAEPAAEPPEDHQEPEPASAGDTGEEETLRHKLASAEGRFTVFQSSLEDMRSKLATLEAKGQSEPEPEPEPEPVAPVLPKGWTPEDWDDYRSDNPVGAELFESQNREVEQLKETVNRSSHDQEMEKAQREFNQTIMGKHPDYLELLDNQREDIRTFIESEQNPLLKQAYQGIYQQGTADQVSELVTAYKASRDPSSTPQTNLQQRRVQDALAVSSRSSSPNPGKGKSGIPDENDFDAAWEYFTDDSID